jgi:hypothetical protein
VAEFVTRGDCNIAISYKHPLHLSQQFVSERQFSQHRTGVFGKHGNEKVNCFFSTGLLRGWSRREWIVHEATTIAVVLRSTADEP